VQRMTLSRFCSGVARRNRCDRNAENTARKICIVSDDGRPWIV